MSTHYPNSYIMQFTSTKCMVCGGPNETPSMIPILHIVRNTLTLRSINWCEDDKRLRWRTCLPLETMALSLSWCRVLSTAVTSVAHRNEITKLITTTGCAILLKRLGIEAASQKDRWLLDSVCKTQSSCSSELWHWESEVSRSAESMIQNEIAIFLSTLSEGILRMNELLLNILFNVGDGSKAQWYATV